MSGEKRGFLQHPSAPRVPGYILTRPLGRGPQAEVWKAYQERTGKWVAVKVFTDRDAFDWEALRANTERLVRLDRHPNVVSLLDADLSADPPFFAMDLMEDGSLAGRISSGEAVRPQDAVSWFEDAARALAYLHGKGLIHGGLKPANILIDEQGRARISDLGQARRAGAGDEAAADAGADIRALADALASVAGKDADEDLSAILAKCRSAADGAAYGSVTALLADLEARRGRLPVSPLADSRAYRLKRFLQRHTAAAVLATACAGAVATGVYQVAAKNAALTSELAFSYSERARNALLQGQPTASALLFAKSNLLKPSAAARRDALAVLAGFAKPRASWTLGEPVQAVAASPDGGRLLAVGEHTYHLYDAQASLPLSRSDGGLSVGFIGPESSVRFGGFGARALLCTTFGKLSLLDVQTGGVLAEFPGEAGAFSTDGSLAAAVQMESEVKGGPNIVLHDGRTGKPTGVRMRHAMPDGQGVRIDLSPDGRKLASVGGGVLRIWDTRTGRKIAEDIDFGSADGGLFIGATQRVSFDPSGTRLLVQTYSEAMQFDAHTGRLVAGPMRHEGRVFSSAQSGPSVVTGGEDGVVRFWSGNTILGNPAPPAMRHVGTILAVAMSPRGHVVASAGEDGTVRFWGAGVWEPFGPILPHQAGVTSLAFSADGKTLVTGSRDGVVRTWDVPEPQESPALFRGDMSAFSPDAKTMVYSVAGEGVFLRSVDDGRDLARELTGPGPARMDLARFDASGSRVIVAGLGSDEVWVWDTRTGKKVSGPLRHPDPTEMRGRPAADISPDGTLVAAGGGRAEVVFWDAATGAPRGPAIPAKDPPSALSFSPDGKRLALAAYDKVEVWDVPPGPKPVVQIAAGGNEAVWSPDGRRLVTGGLSDRAVRVWDARTGEALGPPLVFGESLIFLEVSPDGRRAAAASVDGTARLIDLETGSVVGPPLRHAGSPRGAAFSPDSGVLASCGLDGTVYLWDAQTGAPTGRPLRQGGTLGALAFTSDGRRLWVEGNWRVRAWDLPWLQEEVTQRELLGRVEEATGLRLDERGTALPPQLPPAD